MFMVGTDPVEVERRVNAREFRCRADGAVLGRWGRARRRRVRGVGLVHPRRLRCPSCGVTHVLLPTLCLLRRADGVQVIGQGLTLAAGGAGFRRIAWWLGRSASTVRRWLRRVRVNADVVVVLAERRVRVLDPLACPAPVVSSRIGAVVGAAGRLVDALTIRFGVGKVASWAPIAQVTAGMLLAPRKALGVINTS